MCFSAEASFFGAAALAVIGSATYKVTNNPSNKFWAAMPALFAFQQFCEGVIWLDLQGTISHSAFTVLAKDLFLFFALAFWPVWFPLSFLIAETNHKRKIALGCFLFLGACTAYYNLNAYNILELSPLLRKHSVYYFSESFYYKRFAYLAMVAIPPFISSLKYMKIFSLGIIASFIATEYYYLTTFTSVWCFFGSLMSSMLYLIACANASKVKNPEKVIHK